MLWYVCGWSAGCCSQALIDLLVELDGGSFGSSLILIVCKCKCKRKRNYFTSHIHIGL